MADNTHMLLRSNLKQLRLPTIGAEFEKLAREAAAAITSACCNCWGTTPPSACAGRSRVAWARGG